MCKKSSYLQKSAKGSNSLNFPLCLCWIFPQITLKKENKIGILRFFTTFLRQKKINNKKEDHFKLRK